MIDTLLSGLFDYAGMFPPASLTFEEALHTSARFPTELHRPGMVAADMVVGLADLDRLDEEALEAAGFRRPCHVCVVGVTPDQAEAAVERVETIESVASPVRIDSLEIAAAEPEGAPWEAWRDALAPSRIRLYMEPRWPDARWQEDASEVWNLLAGLKETGTAVGLKFRCAGPTEVSHTTIAEIVAAVNQLEVPLKATQGLHHPLIEEGHGNAHGFVNVVAALRLQHALGLDGATVRDILAARGPEDFAFDALGWREHRALAQRVAEAAQAVPFHIGSCSLHEPDEDLRRLWG